MTQNHRPYANSIELLQAEIEGWIVARSHRLLAEKDLAEAQVPATAKITVVGRGEPTATEELHRRLALLRVAEAHIRAEIDARIDASKATGIDLGLVRVTRDLDLDDVERSVLLLTVIQAIGADVAEPLERFSSFSFGFGDVPLTLVAQFCGVNFAERVGLRLRFCAEGRLVGAGLVVVDLGPSAYPSDWPSASLRLTTKGFNELTGLQVRDAE